MSVAPMAVPNLVQVRPWGLLGKWVKYYEILIIYLQVLSLHSNGDLH